MKKPQYIPEAMGSKVIADAYGKNMKKYDKWLAKQKHSKSCNVSQN